MIGGRVGYHGWTEFCWDLIAKLFARLFIGQPLASPGLLNIHLCDILWVLLYSFTSPEQQCHEFVLFSLVTADFTCDNHYSVHCCGEEASRPIGGNIPGSPPADSGHRYIHDQQQQQQQQSRARAEPASRPYCSSSQGGWGKTPTRWGGQWPPGNARPNGGAWFTPANPASSSVRADSRLKTRPSSHPQSLERGDLYNRCLFMVNCI